MPKILLLNKPFNVLCQFTDDAGRQHLGNYIQGEKYRGFYAAGRLDRDSEGLLLLTDNGVLQNRIAHPKHKMPKTYWVQVEGDISEEALNRLRHGVELKDGMTKPAIARKISYPDVWTRDPPIRERKHIPTSWIELTISEGRNRQVRRMTAAVSFPTLRLIRYSIGEHSIKGLESGEYRESKMKLPPPAADRVESRIATKHSRFKKKLRKK